MDASTVGKGAVTYIRAFHSYSGTYEVAFVNGRARVVSKSSTTTVPKLELYAAVLGSKLHRKIRKAIRFKIEKGFLWTDSMTVLNWMCNRVTRVSKFVARNVAKIEIRTAGDDFRYVPTKLNPADLASRGCPPKHASYDTVWIKGLPFLYQSEDQWPNTADRETKQEPIGSKQMDEADTHCCAAHREVVQEDTTASPVVGEPEIPQEDATPLKEETKKFTQRQQSSS